MRLLLFISVLLLALCSEAKTLRGKIVRVSDGDTVVLLDSTNTQHRIRLDGIDCPEKGQPYGKKATDFVKELTKGKAIVVEWEKKDKYKNKKYKEVGLIQIEVRKDGTDKRVFISTGIKVKPEQISLDDGTLV